MKALSNIFLWTRSTDQWRNMLQTLERWRKYTGIILPDESTLRREYFPKNITHKVKYRWNEYHNNLKYQ